jgi:hypothetical protein
MPCAPIRDLRTLSDGFAFLARRSRSGRFHGERGEVRDQVLREERGSLVRRDVERPAQRVDLAVDRGRRLPCIEPLPLVAHAVGRGSAEALGARIAETLAELLRGRSGCSAAGLAHPSGNDLTSVLTSCWSELSLTARRRSPWWKTLVGKGSSARWSRRTRTPGPRACSARPRQWPSPPDHGEATSS